MSEEAKILEDFGQYKYGFHDPENYVFKSQKGLSREVVENISRMKGEPQWMLDFRLKALEHFLARPMPTWGPDLSGLHLDDIYYYIKPAEAQSKSWDDVPADIKNTFDKLGIPEAERKFLAGVGAQYECLSGDTRVYTARGAIPIRAVVAGDVVFAFNEDMNEIVPAPVKATMPKGKRPVFTVKAGTRTIRATGNHPFLVLEYQREPGRQRGRYARRWKYLCDLKVGDLIAVAKALPDVGQDYALEHPDLEMNWRHNTVSLPERSSPDLMWWLGLYMGDGFIHAENEKARVEIAIPETNSSLRSEFTRVTSDLFNITSKNGDPYRLTVGSTAVARYLEVNGFSGGALEKRFPVWVASLPQEQILAFLGGYVDADGYVRDHPKNRDVVLTSGNLDLLQDVHDLAAVSGLQTSNIHRFQSKHPRDETRTIIGYRMLFSGDFERLRCSSEQRTTRMGERKFQRTYSSAENTSFRNHVNEWFGYLKIDSIEPAGVEPVYDIEVDGPHNFIAEGMIVHNSEMVYHSILEHLEKQGVIFLSIEEGLRQHPDLFREHFGTVIPIEDNKFAALNSAVWSGGSFVYVPKGVKVDLPLQAYFRLNAANIGQFERSLIVVDEGAQMHYVEGCFLEGANVRTRHGEKKIEEIAVGDEVMTHMGRFRKVYHTMKRPYHGDIYNIRFYGDSKRQLRVTEEHPLFVVRRQRASERNKEYQLVWTTASMVTVGDYLVVPVFQPEAELVFPGITIPPGRGRHMPVERCVEFPQELDFYRLLGYYFSEGRVDNEHYLTLSFHADETDLLADAKSLFKRYFGKPPIENAPRQNGLTLVLSSPEAARAFAREFGANVYEKHIPEWILSASPDLLAEFVRGMWLGDGSYDSRKNMFRFNTISSNLAYAFRDALLRLGIASSVNLQNRTAPRRNIYTVIIASPFNPQFGKLVGVDAPAGDLSGSPFTIDENFLYVPIQEITMEEMETEVYNFSVEEDESYVAEGVVSHNCTAPQYTTDSFHSGVIEIIVKRGARSRYTTIQNWSTNVYNLVTQRAKVFGNGTHEWVDANLGCLAEGSTVTTPNGLKTIEDLHVGERILSYDEYSGKLCFRKVTAKRFSGYQPVLRVSAGERSLQVTANHPFYSYLYNPHLAKKSGRYRFGYVRADQLEKAILPRISLEYGKPHFLSLPNLETQLESLNQYAPRLAMSHQRTSRMAIGEYTTDRLMWMFGYWVGDGNMDIKPAKTADVIRYARVGFSTPRTDRAREMLMGVMTSMIDVEPSERADGNHLAWNSKELVEFFQVNGFYGKASTKCVPNWIYSLPESQRLAFIAGLLDADGFINAYGVHIRSSNRLLLKDIASLLITLGITSNLVMEFSEPRKVTILGVECIAHGAYRVSFQPDKRLLPFLSQSFQEKATAKKPPQNQMRRKVGRSQLILGEDVEIVPVRISDPSPDSVPTWDIEVDGTGNFISQGFIVHNSKLTMKYPSCYLMEPGARGEMLSMAFAGAGQVQDAGSKMLHFAPNTTSKITSKSISKGGGRASFRGLLKVYKGAKNVKSNTVCDALLLDPQSRSDTYPTIEIDEESVTIGHEASVSKVGEEQLFYLMSRGLSEEEATTMVVSGFIEPLVKELPMEYAVEMNRLIQLQMEGSIG